MGQDEETERGIREGDGDERGIASSAFSDWDRTSIMSRSTQIKKWTDPDHVQSLY